MEEELTKDFEFKGNKSGAYTTPETFSMIVHLVTKIYMDKNWIIVNQKKETQINLL